MVKEGRRGERVCSSQTHIGAIVHMKEEKICKSGRRVKYQLCGRSCAAKSESGNRCAPAARSSLTANMLTDPPAGDTATHMLDAGGEQFGGTQVSHIRAALI